MGRSLRAPGNGTLAGDAGAAGTEGPAVEAREDSLPDSGAHGEAVVETSGGIFQAQLFDLDLPTGWTNLTAYRLVDPTPGRVQPNLIIQLESRGETVASADERTHAEVAAMQHVVPDFELIEEGEIESADGTHIPRVVFERSAAQAGRIRQWLAFVPCPDCWYTLCLTGEVETPEEVAARMDAILASFVIDAR
jgi:hypothetical protein